MSSANMTGPLFVPPQLHLDNTLGAAFIGLIISAVLFGVTNVQTFIYFQSSSRDPLYLKCIIGFLWILDALQLVLVSHALYLDTVTNFANPTTISILQWSLCAHILVTALSDTIVRLYYTRRVWIMSKGNWLLTAGSGICCVVTFMSTLGFGVKSFTYSSIEDVKRISWILYLSFGSAVVGDVWIAITLCWYLAMNRTGFRQTDTNINIIMTYVINTGLLTGFCAICSLVSFAVMPHTFIFIAFYFNLSKLYLNSLLATLNARDKLREGFFGDSQQTVGRAGPYEMRPQVRTILASSRHGPLSGSSMSVHDSFGEKVTLAHLMSDARGHGLIWVSRSYRIGAPSLAEKKDGG